MNFRAAFELFGAVAVLIALVVIAGWLIGSTSVQAQVGGYAIVAALLIALFLFCAWALA